MIEKADRIPPDINLIGETVVVLNTSLNNAAIYPRNHPGVDALLKRTLCLFQKLFEHRQSLVLAVVRDTLSVENYTLNKKNASYRKFAKLLTKLNIAHLTFLPDLTMDELYAFHLFVSDQLRDLSHPDIPGDSVLKHIRVGFIDYKSFSLEEGKTAGDISQENLWEQYISALIAGMLKTGKFDELEDIPPDLFVQIVNRMHKDGTDETAAEKIFPLYNQMLFERVISGNDIKKLLYYINGLHPDLKERFLDNVVSMLSEGAVSANHPLHGVSPEMVIKMFESAGSRKAAVPDTLKKLIDKLSGLIQDGREFSSVKGKCFVDDIYLPSDTLSMFTKSELDRTIFDTFETLMSDAYQREIQKLSEVRAEERFSDVLISLRKECDDDIIDKVYNLVVVELMISDLISEEEYRLFINTLKEQTSQLMWTGQYGQVLQILLLFQHNIKKNKFPEITSEAVLHYYTQEFFLTFIDSLKIIGRQARMEAWQLCDFYGERIIPFLISSVADEDSQIFRSFLLGLLRQFDERLVPCVLKALNDERWFVKRNMLYLLNSRRSEEISRHVRPYCRHENKKVNLEAIKCLMSMEDPYGLEIAREYLSSESEEDFEQALSLSGTFRVKEAIPDLLRLLTGKRSRKTALAKKILIIQTLGNIGDPSCLDTFRGILSRRNLFFKGSAEKMKEEIYRRLKNFSFADIEDMVQAGVQSRNRYIREESLKLSRTGSS